MENFEVFVGFLFFISAPILFILGMGLFKLISAALSDVQELFESHGLRQKTLMIDLYKNYEPKNTHNFRRTR